MTELVPTPITRSIVVFPANLKFLAAPICQLVDDVEQAITQAGDGRACDYDALEELVAEDTATVERASHKAMLTSR